MPDRRRRSLEIAFVGSVLVAGPVLCAASCGAPEDAGSSVSRGEDGGEAGLAPLDANAPDGPARGTDGGLGDGALLDADVPVRVPPPFLGANVEDGGVVFRVWAPHAAGAAVRGDFATTDVAMQSLDGGVFEAHVPAAHAGSAYRFIVAQSGAPLVRTDPYCREIVGDGCRVVDPGAYSWTAPAPRPARSDVVVYELHVASFAVAAGAAHGTFASTRDALADLAALGINVVELMPVQAFGGDGRGWGYNPQLFHAPMPALGTLDDFRSLVDRAHALGIAVWIDTVVNHADGWSQAPLRCFDGACANGAAGIYFFEPGPYASTPWGPRPAYATSEVATMLVASVDTWLGELRADGLRVDSVSNIRALDGQGTVPGGKELITRINDRVHALQGLSVAEDLKGYGDITLPASKGGFGFDAQWDGFGYTMTDVLVPADDQARDLGRVVGALEGTSGGDAFARLLFLEDHDTVGNGGARLPAKIDGQNPTSFAARRRSMLGAAVLMTTPGVPMLFMGEDFLATAPFTSDAPPLEPPTAEGARVRAFYRAMIRLRRNLDGKAGGLSDSGVEILHRNDGAKVLAYRRYGASGEDVVVVVNLAGTTYARYGIGVADAAPWRVRMDTALAAYGSDFKGTPQGTLTPRPAAMDGKPFTLDVALGAYAAVVLTR